MSKKDIQIFKSNYSGVIILSANKNGQLIKQSYYRCTVDQAIENFINKYK